VTVALVICCVLMTCRTQVTTVSYSVGPFDLAANSMQEFFQVGIPRPSGTIAITDVTVDIINENNDSVQRCIYLHHYVLMINNLFATVCPTVNHRTLTGTGNEYTPLHLPAPYAVIDAATNTWSLDVDIINLISKPLKLYVQYNVTYSLNYKSFSPVTPFTIISVTGCIDNPVYNISGNGGKGSVVVNSTNVTAPISGNIIYAFGHLHDGGYNVSLVDTDSKTLICNSYATYDNGNVVTGNITSVSQCYPKGIWVAEGDQITITATYDNSKPWYNVMGMFLAYIGFQQ